MQKSGFRLVLALILFLAFIVWQSYFWSTSSDQASQQDSALNLNSQTALQKPQSESSKPLKKVSEIPTPPFQENPNSLMTGVANGHSAQEIQDFTGIPVLRAREVTIREDILKKIPLEKEHQLHLSLFADTQISAQVKMKNSSYTNSLFISGPVNGMKYSFVHLTHHDRNLIGRINVGNRGFQLVRSSRNTYYVIEVDITQLPPIDPKQAPNPPKDAARSARSEAKIDGSVSIQSVGGNPGIVGAASAERTVKIVVLYTAKAAAMAGGDAAIRAEIAMEANLANAAFEQSGINAGVLVVHMQKTDYMDAQDMQWDIDRMAQAGDGFLDEAQTLRRNHDADLVHLFTAVGNTACGMHFFGANFEYSNPRAGYGVTARQCNYKMTMAHEVGHGLGADHDPANADKSGFSAGYARGYFDIQAKFRTIMSYHNGCGTSESLCPVIGYFSTPYVTLNGKALGNSNADNARRINELISVVAKNSTLATIEPGFVLNAKPGETYRLNISMPLGLANATRIDWYVDAGSGWQLISGANNYFYDAVTPSAGIRYYYARVLGPDYEIRTSESYISNTRNRPDFNFLQYPQAFTVNSTGGTATFSASVSAPKLSVNYQWTLNGQPVGANSSILTVPNVTANATIGLTVSNSTGSLTAPSVALRVLSKPYFTKNLLSTFMAPIRPAGPGTQLEVIAAGSDNIIYQWYKDGTAIAGATRAAQIFDIVDNKANGTYWVVAKNAIGETQSNMMALTTYGAPKIATQPPAEKLLVPGSTIEFTVQAEGHELSYQWYKDGAALPAGNLSARTNRLVIASATTSDAGHYKLVVSNGAGVAHSNEINVDTPSPPSILTQPSSVISFWGQPVTLAVTTRGYPGPYYRWSHVLNGVTTVLPNTTRELVIPKVDWAHQGQYFVEVYNEQGSVKSTSASIQIRAISRGGSILPTKGGALMFLNRTGGFLPVENTGDPRKEHP